MPDGGKMKERVVKSIALIQWTNNMENLYAKEQNLITNPSLYSDTQ